MKINKKLTEEFGFPLPSPPWWQRWLVWWQERQHRRATRDAARRLLAVSNGLHTRKR